MVLRTSDHECILPFLCRPVLLQHARVLPLFLALARLSTECRVRPIAALWGARSGSATDAPAGLPPLPQSDPRRRSGSQRWARGQTLARSAACSALGLRWLKLWGGVSEFLDEHAGVLAVVDRNRHHMHPARDERLLQGRDQVLRGVHPPAPRAIALRVLDEVGIAEGQAEVGEAVHRLLPADHAISRIVQNEHNEI